MAETPRVPQRPEPRDLTELRALRTTQPELAPAIDLQIELIELLRRLRVRVPTPTAPLGVEAARARLSAGHRLLELSEISLEWADFRLVLRQAADVLRRHDSLDNEDHGPIVAVARESDGLVTLVTAWYAETGVPPAARPELAAHRAAPARSSRPGPVHRHSAISRARGGSGRSVRAPRGMGTPLVSVLRLGARVRRRDSRRRASADVRPLRSAMAVAVRGMSVVRDPRREPARHAREPGPKIPGLRLQQVPPVLEGI